MSLLLGVNIDHVATLRQARYARMPDSPNAEPDPVEAARDAMAGGADSITIHVRGDRRHMQEADAFRIRDAIPLPLNFEMGVTGEMTSLALRLRPDFACLVPETREEITTEGGLDVAGGFERVRATVDDLQAKGIRVSLFIDPDIHQVQAAARSGAAMIELHTGCYANASGDAAARELTRLAEAANAGHAAGLQVNAGHGINYTNIHGILQVPHLAELNIGHSIVARALGCGMTDAVREMKRLMTADPND
ncbi:MAG: pyridoxine 5'-phosphate synthase [Verrucomicrobia bacterium]|nr:pyridoxine 5'-phosphate synthase [Verrucomicrobiota bacterium]